MRPSDSVPLATRVAVESDFKRATPVHVVWELTLACNLSCLHCGSRAGKRRPGELTTAEALSVVDQLARLGTRELSLIGGEAYLRPDWIEIIRHATSLGIVCSMQTGGRALTRKRLVEAKAAGLAGLGVSIDGLAELHDELRGVAGAFDNAVSVLKEAKAVGLRTGVNTQIGPRTLLQLPSLLDVLDGAGATHWQLQLTVAMGNAADNDSLLLQPYQLLELMPLLASLHVDARRRNILIIVGNNIGYFGPYEHLWRQESSEVGHWSGCEAGHTVVGLESDGTIKGCPSLATAEYAVGNVRDASIDTLWNAQAMRFRRNPHGNDRWGFCRDCYYTEVCDAGCTWTTQSLLGRAGNNPYCHYRALDFAGRGLRERIVKVRDASDAPFGTGLFEIVVEHADGSPLATASSTGLQQRAAPSSIARPAGNQHDATMAAAPAPTPNAHTHKQRNDPVLVLTADEASRQIKRRATRHASPVPELSSPDQPYRTPVRLHLCGACNWYIKHSETVCPFCGTDVEAGDELANERHHRRVALMNDVRALLENRVTGR